MKKWFLLSLALQNGLRLDNLLLWHLTYINHQVGHLSKERGMLMNLGTLTSLVRHHGKGRKDFKNKRL
ncbi:hypothetical protein ACJW30_08G020000 [Castanea mollissima]